MILIKQALVAVDLSKMDNQLLSYSDQFSSLLNLDKIHFVHVIPNFLGRPEISFAEDNSVATAIDDRVKTLIQKKIKQQFSNDEKNPDLVVDVLEGSPYDKILNYTNDKEVDLLITGHKKKSEASGLTARRIAQQAGCHVLFVTEKAKAVPDKILVPIDFSKNSANALQAALNFKKIIPEIEITAVKVIQMLPVDYHLDFNTNPVYKEAFLVKTQKEYISFIKKYEIAEEALDIVFLENMNFNAARQIHNYAIDKNFDLVIMGAKGHSTFENFLYGSVTELLVDLCEDIPVFVVRNGD